jgi:hypothetical protein
MNTLDFNHYGTTIKTYSEQFDEILTNPRYEINQFFHMALNSNEGWSIEEFESITPKHFCFYIKKAESKLCLPKQQNLDFRLLKKEIKKREKRAREKKSLEIKIREKFKFQGRKT